MNWEHSTVVVQHVFNFFSESAVVISIITVASACYVIMVCVCVCFKTKKKQDVHMGKIWRAKIKIL